MIGHWGSSGWSGIRYSESTLYCKVLSYDWFGHRDRSLTTCHNDRKRHQNCRRERHDHQAAQRHLPRAFHPVDEDPTLCIQRDLELIEHLDRLGYDEAWIGEHHSAGYEIIPSPEVFIAAAAERTKRIMLGTGVVSLPYHIPLMTANRDHAARSPDARPRDVRRRAGPSAVRRVLDGHRSVDAARPHGGSHRGHPAPLGRRARHAEVRLVHSRRRDLPAPALHLAASGNRGGVVGHAVGRQARRPSRLRHAVRGGDADGRLRRARDQLGRRQQDGGRERPQDGSGEAAPRRSGAYRRDARAGVRERQVRLSPSGRTISPASPRVAGARRWKRNRSTTWSRRASSSSARPTMPSRRSSACRAKQGEFGCFLQLAHNWANFENDQEILRAVAAPCDAGDQRRERGARRRPSTGRATTRNASSAPR